MRSIKECSLKISHLISTLFEIRLYFFTLSNFFSLVDIIKEGVNSSKKTFIINRMIKLMNNLKTVPSA